MSLPKEWDSKPIVFCMPTVLRGFVFCHNCSIGYRGHLINSCTGLCPQCAAENPVVKRSSIPINYIFHKATTSPEEPIEYLNQNCKRCSKKIIFCNFGIMRDVCNSCTSEDPILKTSCVVCNIYRTDCYLSVCRGCRSGCVLCQNTGYFYRDMGDHYERCWCLPYEEREVRRKTIRRPPRSVVRAAPRQSLPASPYGRPSTSGRASTVSTPSGSVVRETPRQHLPASLDDRPSTSGGTPIVPTPPERPANSTTTSASIMDTVAARERHRRLIEPYEGPDEELFKSILEHLMQVEDSEDETETGTE